MAHFLSATMQRQRPDCKPFDREGKPGCRTLLQKRNNRILLRRLSNVESVYFVDTI